jgi:hypothetical protein
MTSDQVERLAQYLVEALLSRPAVGAGDRPLFRVASLGDKYPVADLLVDAVDASDQSIGYFFVQVKGTEAAPKPRGRLGIQVPADSYNQLVRVLTPTYLIGVDVVRERAYLVAAHIERRAQVSSITTAFNLADDQVRMDLFEEIRAFWDLYRAPFRQSLLQSRFHDV